METVLGNAEAVVSITSHGLRIQSVALAIESIGAGSVRPRRLVLWLDDAEAYANLPQNLRRLQARGLEIRLTENYGPHTKYYPYVREAVDGDELLITADDDMIVPRWWLERLIRAARKTPDAVTCYRAHRVRFTGGSLAKYEAWDECWSSRPSALHFLTGVSGAAYPPSFVSKLREHGEGFSDRCPRADDVWINYLATIEGFPVRQVRSMPLKFATVPESQQIGLFHGNVLGHGNDPQIANTYDDEALSKLRAAERTTTK